MRKRSFDIAISSIGLLLLLPLFLVIGIAIKLSSRGPVFYKGNRIGRHGEPFGMYKFRSMITDAAKIGPSVTYQDDPRITRVGRFLRGTKLDELPQLINVLKGDMSLVGPRPETDDHVIHYTPEQRRVLNVRPGIAGLAQIEWHDEESRIDQARLKQAPWRKWGPYLSERQWGTVREDYSKDAFKEYDEARRKTWVNSFHRIFG